MSARPGIEIRGAVAALAAVLALGACVPNSAPVRPTFELPAQWNGAPADGHAIRIAGWWTIYEDAVLERLVEEALLANMDLFVAVARVDEARALLAQTEADRRPYVDATLDADRRRASENTGAFLTPGGPVIRNNIRATVNASYEFDLWDRLRNATVAARADLLAAEAARDTVRIALTAQVAQSYFTLRALDAQIQVSRRSIEVRERSLELQRQRVAAGVLAELDLRQVEAEIAAVRAQLAPLEGARAREEAALAVLLGRGPRAIMEEVVAANQHAMLTQPPPLVPAGLPSELLLRRPDIIEAEQRLEAANTRVAIARVAHFPSIALTGYLGWESATLGALFNSPAAIWNMAAALAQPIYAGGRLRAELDAATARERQALARYQGVVQGAFRDVRAALATQAQARATYEAEQTRVAALEESVRLARLRYEGGLSSQLELLDAERQLLAAEINRVDALRIQHAAIANLMQALGGGW